MPCIVTANLFAARQNLLHTVSAGSQQAFSKQTLKKGTACHGYLEQSTVEVALANSYLQSCEVTVSVGLQTLDYQHLETCYLV